MGDWGNRNFENDQALDFTDEFLENPSDAALVEALTLVAELSEESEYIESGEASTALAAAEIIAATVGKPSADFPEKLRTAANSLQTGANADVRKLARKAVELILKESELKELWADAEDGEPTEWQAVQQDLLARLK
ncbi:DUF4259 domain-containing protein [uncultured Hymenobacter sp.]|uniref:DUF4259 domain-containing protein n=1 Tax=uncultured Hymenobacter sp. TaxID=170016 RepID=UPI0035CB53B2